MNEPLTILIAPLDWGLGHATRCVPLIHQYSNEGHKVILGVYGLSGEWLKKEFPDVKSIPLPGMQITYPKNDSMKGAMLRQTPSLLRSIRREHQLLQKIIIEEKIDLVISDNRYGLYSEKTKCIIITHQLFIQGGIFSGIIKRINHFFLKKFSEIWVPDYKEPPGLAGELSHGKSTLKSVRYIGPLSRFREQSSKKENAIYDVLILLSGPEPQRSILEENLGKHFQNSKESIVLVRGSNSKIPLHFPPQTVCHNLASSSELAQFIQQAKRIICRSGYSTIMDLHALNRLDSTVTFVPTPGQTEQEYLAKIHSKSE